MGERDKIEPFWARSLRGKRRAPPLVVPEKAAEPPPVTPPPADDAPREPSFAVSTAARREAIAALIARPSEPGDEATPRAAPSLGLAPPAPMAEPDADGWVKLSQAEAEKHRLFGVHGFLVVLAIFAALGLVRALIELVDFWATTDHGGLAAWIMAVLRSVMALWAALVLGLLIGHSRAFPTSFVAYAMVDVIYLALFGLAFAHVTQGVVFTGVAVAVALNFIAIAYVLRSRRVNVTYRHRVLVKKVKGKPPGDPRPDAAQPSHA